MIFNFILLRQEDIDRLIDYPKILRDQIIIDFSRLQGFRTKEIAVTRWQDINLEDGFVRVSDSKKQISVLLPLHWMLGKQLMKLKEEQNPKENDYIIQHLPEVNVPSSSVGKPFSNNTIRNIVKDYAHEAGIFDWNRYNPTLLRAYFAANWYRKGRSLKMLQYMMRHNSLHVTFRYVGKILFWSEISREFDRVQNDRRTEKKLNINEILEHPVARQCLQCPAVKVCKYVDKAIHNEYADGCKYFREIVEKVKETKIAARAIPIDSS